MSNHRWMFLVPALCIGTGIVLGPALLFPGSHVSVVYAEDHAPTPDALMSQAAALEADGKYHEAGDMYGSAGKAYDAAGQKDRAATAYEKSAAMYEKEANALLGGSAAKPPSNTTTGPGPSNRTSGDEAATAHPAPRTGVIRAETPSSDRTTGVSPSSDRSPMTKQELIEFMKRVLPGGPSSAFGSIEKTDAACRPVVEEIRRRGVSFYDANPGWVYQYVPSSIHYDVASAIQDNFGRPTPLRWLMGTWDMTLVAGVVHYAPGDGYIYVKGESAGRMGFLMIKPDGTYVWKIYPTDPPQKYIQGKWRKATDEEMGLQGGAGLILRDGEDGHDWIVTKSINHYLEGDNIRANWLEHRGIQRTGSRVR